MKSGRLSKLVLLLIVFALTLPPLKSVNAADDSTLFINLTSDDPWTAKMAFHYAKQVQEIGHPVVVFLNVRGVRLADKAIPDGSADPDTQAAQETLQAMIADGATVYVCRMCTTKAEMSESDWIEGVKPGSKETIDIQMAESTRVMSY